MKAKLSTNALHVSAADAYRRARNCIHHSRLSPHTAERELRSAAYWRQSAEFWRSQAALDAQPVTLPPVRKWAVSVSWEDEIALLLTSPAAIAAEVE
jgi:hypothetical protein